MAPKQIGTDPAIAWLLSRMILQNEFVLMTLSRKWAEINNFGVMNCIFFSPAGTRYFEGFLTSAGCWLRVIHHCPLNASCYNTAHRTTARISLMKRHSPAILAEILHQTKFRPFLMQPGSYITLSAIILHLETKLENLCTKFSPRSGVSNLFLLKVTLKYFGNPG